MIPKEIIIHHTASSRDKTTLADINAWHKTRWPYFKSSLGYYIGYHFVILGKGEIIQARKENEIGAHCIPNEGKLGIALCGDFETEMPNPSQLTSLEKLLEKLKKEWILKDENIFGHCEKSQTLCPGKEVIKWLNLYRQVSLLKKMIAKLLELLKTH